MGRHVQRSWFTWVVSIGLIMTAGRLRGQDFNETRLPTVTLEDVVVTASHSINQQSPSLNVTLDKEQVEALPHFGNDLYRVLNVLPGVIGTDQSAAFSIRGSLPREVLVEFDGVELYEPFHLKDFQGVFSIIDPEAVDSLDLTTGGFTAEFGNRSAGVLDITSVEPDETRHSAGVSLSSSWINSAGRFADDRASWFVSARRGYLDLLLDIVDTGEDDEGEEGDTDPAPRYWDIYAKVGFSPSPDHVFTVNVLASQDTLTWEETEEDEEIDLDTSYGNTYFWINHQGQFGGRLSAETILSLGWVDQDRQVFLIEDGDESDVDDDRNVDLVGLKQRWGVYLSERQFLKLGWEFNTFNADYDYSNSFDSGVPIPDDRFLPPMGGYEFRDSRDGEHVGAYLADRIRLFDHLVTEIGLRYDHHSITDEDFVSPRLNAVYELEEDSRLHLGLGHYYQTHRPNELDVQDRETEFFDAEKAEQISLGYEQSLDEKHQFRIDAYYRTIGNPRPRYENVFDPFNDENPEASPDRARLDSEKTVAWGIEALLAKQSRERTDWSLVYSYSSIEDTINGRDTKRSIDQPHSLTATFTFRPTSRWNLTAVWHYHTGWPRTEVTAQQIDGEIIPIVGEFYDERHPDYHRLDLRASYRKPLSNSTLTYFIDIQNLYNRRNIRGFNLDEDSFVPQADGSVAVNTRKERWLGILPSFGIKYDF